MQFVKGYMRHLLVGMQQLTEEKLLGLLTKVPDATLLDIGCNNGVFTRQIAEKIGAKRIFGIEIDRNNAHRARDRGINIILADASKDFPFRDEVFDVIVSNQVIEHLNNTDVFVREILRTLKQDGYCVVATPNLAGIHNIISLFMGFQPPTAHVSDELFACGNPFNPDNNIVVKHFAHRRIFTALALKSLFEFHGLKCEQLTGFGLHPLPLFISGLVKSSRYSAVIAIKASKTAMPPSSP